MDNPFKNTVQITLGGKERSLKFNLNGLVAGERELGDGISLLDLNMASNIRGALWASLIHEDNSLTIDAVGDMIGSSAELRDVLDALRQSWGIGKPTDPLFGGSARVLKFNMNGLAAAEKELGFQISMLNLRKLTATQFRAALWAGLLHEDKSMTLAAAGDLVESSPQVVDLFMLILESWGLGKQPDPTPASA